MKLAPLYDVKNIRPWFSQGELNIGDVMHHSLGDSDQL